MDFIKILLVYNSVEKCEKIQNLFSKYTNIICDYDIYANINDIDSYYDILIYEIFEKNEKNTYIINKPNNMIYIANNYNGVIEDSYIKKIMNNGFDMYIFNELNSETVHHMLCIYDLISKSFV